MFFHSSKSPLRSHPYINITKCIYALFCVALLALITLYAIRPIMDLDFWWHLKTGEVMLQQKALLSIDPFNYTGDVIVRGRESVILNGYWLWQITAAFLFGAWGFNGILFLKIITATLIFGVLNYQMLRQKLSEITRITLVTFGTLVIVSVYNLERPQVYSILFITILIGMIAHVRREGSPCRTLWPMMVLWANIHGGFVVGDILLGLAAAGFLIQYRHENRKLVKLILWIVIGISASFINPNGWSAFHELFNFMNNSIGPAFVSEYRNSWFLFSNVSKMAAVCLWAISTLHLIGLLMAPRRYWPEIFISLFIIAFGLTYLRNAGFIAVSLLPVTGWYLEHAFSNFKKGFLKYVKVVICIVCTTTISWMVLQELNIRKSSPGPVAYTIPVDMANFLKSSGLSGNLFNEYGIGGFLDWSLYPQWKTFIDGRELDTKVSNHYLKIALASMEMAEGRRKYELLLDKYGIDVIAMRTTLSAGHLQPLLKVLIGNPDWIPVFQDWMSFVLVRNSARNSDSIKKFGIDKSLFLDTLLQTTESMIKAQPNNQTFSVLQNEALVLKRGLIR